VLKKEPVGCQIGGTYVIINTQLSTYNTDRVDVSTETNSKMINFVNTISPSPLNIPDGKLIFLLICTCRRETPLNVPDEWLILSIMYFKSQTIPSQTIDTATFSDTFSPSVNIFNDRAHLQEECLG